MARSKATGIRAKSRAGDRSTRDGAMDVYNEMLRDALSSSPPPGTVEDRPIKRRKTARGLAVGTARNGAAESSPPVASAEPDMAHEVSTRSPAYESQQMAYNDSDESEDSEFDWEEVDLVQTADPEQVPSSKDDSLSLVLGGDTKSALPDSKSRKRKPATAAERKLRLEIHKLHVLCLLAHVHLRNHWCNDEAVHVRHS